MAIQVVLLTFFVDYLIKWIISFYHSSTLGSPLVCPVRGDMSSLAQFGVDSFVDKKTCDGITGYTNVALYNDWIKKQAED